MKTMKMKNRESNKGQEKNKKEQKAAGKKQRNRIIVCTLIAALVLALCPAVFAAEKTVRISNNRELKDFAKNCSYDEYSKGLKVVLTGDIDLAGEEVSIPVFLGTFDGRGHKITGLSMTSENSRLGLFGWIEKGAVVKNLNVEGDVAPEGSQQRVGGLAGENLGSIENCTFTGLVSADGQTGGIAGLNESGGIIRDCSVGGIIRGKQFTGGIAGRNAGSLIHCINDAAVNTTVSDEDLTIAELEDLDGVVYDFLKNRKSNKEVSTTTDTGGITGYSTGVVQSCENSGRVGYEHVGYNVGGIAGRQSGYISSCMNHGQVHGRKDVGGIVGQMAPDVTMKFSKASINKIQKELNSLQTLIDGTTEDAENVSDIVSGHLSQVSIYAEAAGESAHQMSGQLTQFVDDNVETVNGTLLLAQRYVTKFTPILDDLADASESMSQAAAGLEDAVSVLESCTSYNDDLLSRIGTMASEMSAAGKDMQEGIAAMRRAFAILEKGADLPDTGQLERDLKLLVSESNKLNEIVDQAVQEYEKNGTVSAETRSVLTAQLKTVFEVYSQTMNDLNTFLSQIDIGAIVDSTKKDLQQFAHEMQTAMKAFDSASGHVDKALAAMEQSTEILKVLNRKGAETLNRLSQTLDAASKAADSTRSAFRKASGWAKELGEEDPITFATLGSAFTENSDDLNASLNGINNELSSLSDSVNTSNKALLSDVRQLNHQFMKVMNLFLDLIEEVQDTSAEDVIKDVSENDLYAAVWGKVQESVNDGEVAGDRNTGGIAGSMAIEYDADPEDDLLPENLTGKVTYQTRAILMDCKNSGTVTAKKSCVGSVVGRMDMGTVYRCGGYGDVTSESGEYAGGICGLSLSSVQKSFAKCTLSAKRYVGGIAGSGKRVSRCVSMVEIVDGSSAGGAIAGEITGSCKGNRFVSEDLAGVDRISRKGKAEPITYKQMLKIKNLPDEMKSFTLKFVLEDNVLKEETFAYGDSFDKSDFPTVKEKEGYYVKWDKEDLTNLHFDTVVTAEYMPYVTALAGAAGGQVIQKSDDGRDVFLVEGDFDEKAVLSIQQLQEEDAELPTSLKAKSVLEIWQVSIPDDGQETHKIHYLMPSDDDLKAKNLKVYVKTDDASGKTKTTKWKKIDTEEFGSYLLFEISGNAVDIVVVEKKGIL